MKEFNINEYVEGLVHNARVAQAIYAEANQQQLNKAVRAVARVVYDNAVVFAEDAVAETGMGTVEGKILKQKSAMTSQWCYTRDKKSTGVIGWEQGKLDVDCILKIAKPIGVVAAVMPVTNPTTTMGANAMYALKSGNAIIVCPHPRAKNVSLHCANLMREALVKIGMPADLVQCVEEPSIEDATEILLGIKSYYENYHRVRISDALVKRTVILSERYITDRFLPDKAIDLLDEACTCANLRNKAISDYQLNEQKLEDLKLDEEELYAQTENVDYEAIANIKSEIVKCEDEQKELAEKASDNAVKEEDIAKVIELWTGIPASKVIESDLKRLANLEATLKERIIGQDEAVEAIAAAIRRSRVQISPRRRPASFIFVGPTGVGKTELVKQIAKELFNTPETLIRLDMSEFMEKHSVSRIIGSPPGYVGYDEAGQLTEKVRRKPYSVILFDEIEKAHPDVMNILLQILDEGRITDAQGRTVNFENTIIVMTSNAGSEQKNGALGFGKDKGEATKERITKALSDFLRPEFLGRVDEIAVFNSLTENDYEKISVLLLKELKESLREKPIELSWTDAVPAYLAKKAVGGKRGARDLRNIIRKEIEDKIASIIIDNYEESISAISIEVNENKLEMKYL